MRLFEIAESSHSILNPISLDKLLLAGEVAGLDASQRVLDLCCGKGETLAQWAARFGCSGHGVDVSTAYLKAAAARAEELGVSERVTFSGGNAADYQTEERFDVVCCIGASWFAGGLVPSIQMMRGWTKPSGTLMLGECFWIEEPTPEATAVLGEEFVTLPVLFAELESMALEVVEMVVTDPAGWDRYCAAQWRNLYDWIVANPGDPDVEAAKARLKADRKNYVTVQRDSLGWGVFVIRPALS